MDTLLVLRARTAAACRLTGWDMPRSADRGGLLASVKMEWPAPQFGLARHTWFIADIM